MSDSEPRVPEELREGVRAGILAALEQDVQQRGGRTAGRLVFAGVMGVTGAIGAILIVSNHGFDHHPYWHEMVFSAIWAGVLVVTFSLLVLQVQTPRLPIARGAAVGLVGLGMAGVCSLACPDAHVLEWWLSTSPGAALAEGTWPWASVLCFGLVSIFAIGLGSGALLLERGGALQASRIAGSFLALLLIPGIVLESVGFPPGVLAAWVAGSAAGAYGGVAGAALVRSRVLRR